MNLELEGIIAPKGTCEIMRHLPDSLKPKKITGRCYYVTKTADGDVETNCGKEIILKTITVDDKETHLGMKLGTVSNMLSFVPKIEKGRTVKVMLENPFDSIVHFKLVLHNGA
jgi:hypothetical protein